MAEIQGRGGERKISRSKARSKEGNGDRIARDQAAGEWYRNVQSKKERGRSTR